MPDKTYQDDVTQILNDLANAVKELNAVNYDILRIVDDDWSKMRVRDSEFLRSSMETAEKLLQNEKLNNLEGKEYLGNATATSGLLLELKDYITRLKLLRTYYELKQDAGESGTNIKSA